MSCQHGLPALVDIAAPAKLGVKKDEWMHQSSSRKLHSSSIVCDFLSIKLWRTSLHGERLSYDPATISELNGIQSY